MPSAWSRSVGPTGTNLTGLNATTGLTVAFWARPSPLEAAQPNGDIFGQSSTANTARDGYYIVYGGSGLTLRVCGSATSSDSNVGAQIGTPRHGRWNHWCVTFDDATNLVRMYRDGQMIGATTNATDMTANAACTTRIHNSTVQGQFIGNIFDVQVLPDVVVPPADVRLLMNPKYTYQGVKGRYYGIESTRVAASGTLVDESGNGNNLTNGAAAVETADEPPYNPTYV